MNKTLVILLFQLLHLISGENVLTTEVFEIKIDPSMFNWTYEGIPEQYVYEASLKGAPDLPKWMNYVYSHKHKSGFLYGVPPPNLFHVHLDIIALNRKTYQTKQKVLSIHISEKLNPAKCEVQLKIDNLNVEDMFDTERMDRLREVFMKRLWKESDEDLYVTFLASAIELGARLPADPNDGNGVVLRIGSRAPLSSELIELQEEVKPLWKVPSCPRDFKRTTVERYFRDAGFNLDWCAFRLLEDNSSAMQHSGARINNHFNINNEKLMTDSWRTLNIEKVPERSYADEFLFTILLPMIIMTILAFILTLVLCFHHEGMEDPISEDYFHNLFHICTDKLSSSKQNCDSVPSAALNYEEDINSQFTSIQKATQSLRNFSNAREFSCMSPDSNHLVSGGSYTNSPTETMARAVHCRPSPPPYVRPKYKPNF